MKHTIYKACMLWAALATIGLSSCQQDEEWVEESPVRKPTAIEDEVASRSVSCNIKTTAGGQLLAKLDSMAAVGNYAKEEVTELTISGPVTREDLRILRPFQKMTKLDLTNIKMVDEWGNQSDRFPENVLDSLASPAHVYLPTSITYMEWDSFRHSQITGVDMPDNITGLSSGIFYDCPNLATVKLSQKLTELSHGLFQNCPSLMSIDIPESITALRGYAIAGTGITSFTIPETITIIEEGLFNDCKSLEKVTWSPTITEIPNYCFMGCEKLQFEIPDYITRIGYYAFCECNAISELKIPASVKEIGNRAFQGCKGFTKIQLPTTVEVWGVGMFQGCINLETVTGMETWTEIPNYMFQFCSKLNIEMPQQLVTIGNRAFERCYQLRNPKFPATLKVIDEGAFCDCDSINQIILPEGIEKIGSYAFQNLRQLKEITFPSSLKEAGERPLQYCSNLKVVYWNTEAEMPRLSSHNIPFIYAKAGIAYDKNNDTNMIFGDDTNGWYAENFFLPEDKDFYCPKSFTAKKVVFRRWNGDGRDMNGYPLGWQTISLPFTASKFVVKEYGDQPQRNLKPFGSSDMGDAKPFWLRSLHSDGFQRETVIEAGKPYIICFPNSDQYLPEYNINGTIEYWGENTVVMASTDELTPAAGPDFTMHATFQRMKRAEDIYTLANRDVYDENGNHLYWGQVWVPNNADVNRYQAYVKANGTAARSYSMGNGSATSRAAKVLGSVPQESDMD